MNPIKELLPVRELKHDRNRQVHFHWSTLHLASYWLVNFDKLLHKQTKRRGFKLIQQHYIQVYS